MHYGVDYPCKRGTLLLCVSDGIVLVSKYNEHLGEYITIKHKDGTFSLYAHLTKRTRAAGATVHAGDVIGQSGSTGDSTGPHLHFGRCRMYNAQNVNASKWFDPLEELKEAAEMVTKCQMQGDKGLVTVDRILKDGTNYVRLRDLEKLVSVKVDYDEQKKMPTVKSV